MIRIGDKVCPILDMTKVGKVVDIFESSPKTWMIGGSMMKMLVATVLYNGNEIEKVQISELMRLDG